MLLLHSNQNQLARHSKKNTEIVKKTIAKVDELIIKPMDIKPISTLDNDDIGQELGGKLSKSRLSCLYYNYFF